MKNGDLNDQKKGMANFDLSKFLSNTIPPLNRTHDYLLTN